MFPKYCNAASPPRLWSFDPAPLRWVANLIHVPKYYAKEKADPLRIKSVMPAADELNRGMGNYSSGSYPNRSGARSKDHKRGGENCLTPGVVELGLEEYT